MTIISIVGGTRRIILKNMEKEQVELEIIGRNDPIQTKTLLKSARNHRRAREILRDLMSL